jgi:hypothetical protein
MFERTREKLKKSEEEKQKADVERNGGATGIK